MTQLAQKLFSFTIIILMKQKNYYQCFGKKKENKLTRKNNMH